nr:filamentous hemagglutinin family protein [Nitrospiraceae bacterium]
VIEAFASAINVYAGGDMALGSVVNPTLVESAFTDDKNTWELTYTPGTSVSLAAGGNITVTGDDQFHSPSNTDLELVLPATVTMNAGGDIHLANKFAMTPSENGNLTLTAGGNIDGSTSGQTALTVQRAWMLMSDLDDTEGGGVYTPIASLADVLALPESITIGQFNTDYAADTMFNPLLHDPGKLLHGSDTTGAVTVHAAGDIKDIQLFLPKEARISAGGNIQDLYYLGQNNLHGGQASDVSVITAGGDIIMSAYYSHDASGGSANAAYTGFEQDGPGLLVVSAGGSIDLGMTAGISAPGASNNALLGTEGSGLVIIAGYSNQGNSAVGKLISSAPGAITGNLNTLFGALVKYGDAWLKDKGDSSAQTADLGGADSEVQNTLGSLGSADGAGIKMTSSQISTLADNSSIYIISKGGIDVGQSAFLTPVQQSHNLLQNTGIFTAGGGNPNHDLYNINIYSGGDLNVNESRVMTFYGGTINIWSEYGNVNAGRGSKAAVNASAPKKVAVLDGSGNIIGYTMQFIPPAAGSGVRATTYSPGPGRPGPEAGDINVYTPRGVTDAGEAGISGNNVTIAAQHVLNAQNISVSGIGAGIPVQSAAPGMGALSGAGSVAGGATQLAQQTAGLSASSAGVSQALANAMLDWLDVTVMDLSNNEFGSKGNEQKE